MKKFRKISLLAVLFSLGLLNSNAQNVGDHFQVGGFYYAVISNVYPNFEVAFCGYYYNAQGNNTNSIIVPPTVTYNDDEYTVTKLIACNLTSNQEARISYTIPNTIKYIEQDAINGVRQIILEDGNQNYVLENGLLMNIGKDTVFACEVGQTTDAEYDLIVPSGVKVIADAAFRLCDRIKTITLPSSLTHINKYAFSKCKFISCTMPEGITHIETGAFYNCVNLKQITIPKSVTIVGDRLFSGCDSLKTMYYKATNATCTTGNYTIMEAKNLDKVIVGNEVESLPAVIFAGCPKITQVNFPESLRSIGNWAFRNCNRITSLDFPDSLESIGEGAFSGVVSVEEITIPEGVKYLGNSCFENTTSLVTVHFNAKHCTVGDIYNKETKWTNVTTATIGNNVEIIPWCLFANCKSLKTITIPTSVDTIGEFPFLNCDSLETVYYYPQNAIYDVSGWEEGIAKDGKIQQFIIGDDVESIPQCLLNNEKGITEISFPQSLKSIGRNAFANCGNLQSAQLPDNLTFIGDKAFYSTAISELSIPQNVAYIGKSAFENCMNLETVYYNATNAEYVWDGNEMKGMFAGDTNLTEIIIADNVEKIPHLFFKDNKKIQNFNLPKDLKYIGCYAFANTNIKEITINADTIGQQAFDNCDSLNIINYNSSQLIKQGATYYGDGIFKNCKNIEKLTINDNVLSMPYKLFLSCKIDTIYSYPLVAPSIDNTGSFISCTANYIGVPCVAYDDYYSKWKYSFNDNIHRLGDAAYTTINETICDGEEFEFNGEKLTKSGVYIANLLNKYECDSIVTLNLNVNPSYDTIIETIMLSGDTYSLNGFSKQSEGNYIQELQTINGCDSTIHLNLTTLKIDTIILHDTVINTLYDTIMNNVYDTVTLYDTLTLTNYDTITLHDTIETMLYDTVTLFDTIETTLYDTVTLFDTIETTLYDTVTLFDTITLTEYVYDTINTIDTLYIYDTITPCAKTYTYIYATIMSGTTYEGYGFIEKDAGTYKQTFKTEDGCDSIVTLYLEVTSGIDEVKQTEVISVYPNPASENVTIQAKGNIAIINSKGQVIRTLDNPNNLINLNVTDFESGVYYIKAGNVTKKLVIK